jgi:hypothetical protein
MKMMTTTTQSTRSKPLIAGVLRKTFGPDAGAAPARTRGFSAAERAEVRKAAGDGRDAQQRTIDHVVDRLLRELTW